MTGAPDFDQPLVSIDVVPFQVVGGVVRVILGRRPFEPARGELALPGVLLGRERSEEGARRALRTKTGVERTLLLRDLAVFDAPGRDSRGPTLSIAKVAVVDDEWTPPGDVPAHAIPLDELPELPFDHASIVEAAAAWAAGALWSDREATRALLGEVFTTAQAAAVENGLRAAGGLDGAVDGTNLKRRIKLTGWLEETDPILPRQAGRPSTTWRWAAGS